MSEKTKTPKVIYIALHNMQNLEDEGLQGGFSTIKKHITGGATAYTLKSMYDELLDRLGKVECYVIDLRREKDELSLENARLAADLESLKNLLKTKIAGGGGGYKPLEGTGGIAYGVGGESENPLPPAAHGGTGYFTETSEGKQGIVPQGHTSIEEQIVHSGSPQNTEQVNPNGSKWDDPANNKGWEGIASVPIEEYLKLSNELTKVQAELKECKEGFTKQIDEFYELRKVTIDTINQRNELLIENEKLKAEPEKVKAELYLLNTQHP